MNSDAEAFEALRPELRALAYRMLGDAGSAQDIVQDAWVRWQARTVVVDAPRAYLVKTVTRLCLNELGSARVRREQARSDRLPEPVALGANEERLAELYERISMAFLVVLQRLAPAQRAALLLHDVFGYTHAEVGEALEKSEDNCRQLLRRAKARVAGSGPGLDVSEHEHQRLLRAFVRAASEGDIERLRDLLTDDVRLIADAGPSGGQFGRVRNLPGPVYGATKVAAFVAAVAPAGPSDLEMRPCRLNNQPAIVFHRNGAPHSAILLGVTHGLIDSVFIHADPSRLCFTAGGF